MASLKELLDGAKNNKNNGTMKDFSLFGVHLGTDTYQSPKTNKYVHTFSEIGTSNKIRVELDREMGLSSYPEIYVISGQGWQFKESYLLRNNNLVKLYKKEGNS